MRGAGKGWGGGEREEGDGVGRGRGRGGGGGVRDPIMWGVGVGRRGRPAGGRHTSGGSSELPHLLPLHVAGDVPACCTRTYMWAIRGNEDKARAEQQHSRVLHPCLRTPEHAGHVGNTRTCMGQLRQDVTLWKGGPLPAVHAISSFRLFPAAQPWSAYAAISRQSPNSALCSLAVADSPSACRSTVTPFPPCLPCLLGVIPSLITSFY